MTEGAETAIDSATRGENALAGAVDWGLADRVGRRLARPGPAMSQYTRDAVHRELATAAERAEGPVRDVTALADDRPVPAARVLERADWIGEATQSMSRLTGGGDTSGLVAGKPAGLQMGAALAYLSSAILGQYDPFSGDDGTLLLIAPNVVSVERALRVRPSDFRMWVCLHEVTHRVQFSSAPWLAGYMQESVDLLAGEDEESITDAASRIVTAVRSRGETSEEGAPGGVLGVLRATQPPAQRAALDRLLVLGTLLEGHADHVMDAVGPAVVPTVATIRGAFDRRRARRGDPLQRLVRALLGLDAKMAQYVRGKAFVDAVVGRVGMAEFNTIWTDADTLPTLAEIERPEAWIARVLA
ncbi:hydrolase [Rhodococcus rhodnii]|uniref:Hydrolase n=2 Tax=Rhodococcus rhodnii TaxID=38312 RepID=R7WSF9_9NOCA|nr:zinc-dependent metalloprotease [Rhodococcus rhodnii]EOM78277.1 hypothetical protein Rrhod_0362 [Rhodococcus rhodnii LMG 5362]TXG89286.1 hydrolase [Rhodococcus rhodnii]